MFPKEVTLQRLNAINENTLAGHIGIEFTEIGSDYLIARMPVDERTVQPYKILHGGASVVLSETLGSQAAAVLLDLDKQYPVGLEINANHIKSISSGYVYGRVTPIHIGRSTHVWETRITDEKNSLICISKLTVAILNR
jgi:1,4-dihydroxy-2-naphthoyl-CoA hydrolase